MAEVLIGPHPSRWRAMKTIVQNTFGYLFGTAFRNWFRNVASTAPALGSMTLLLFLVGLAAMAGLVAKSAADTESKDAAVLHVYLADNATDVQVDSLRTKLEADPDVGTVSYVSKDEALQRAQHRPGLPDLAKAADSNPFPASLDVQVRSVSRVGAVDALARKDPAVDPTIPTSYDPGAYRRFQQVMIGIAVGLVAFLLLLAFIAVSVTANSIRAAILSRRDEIGIMQLVGAPRWMVRGPFVIEGALTGGVAGVLSALLALALAALAVQAGAAAFAQVAPGLTLQTGAAIAALLLAAGPTLGSLSSLGSVRRYLEA